MEHYPFYSHRPHPLAMSGTPNKKLFEIHVRKDGHVTITCECPRCERERDEAERGDAATTAEFWRKEAERGTERNLDGTPYKVGESGCGRAEADGRDTHGS